MLGNIKIMKKFGKKPRKKRRLSFRIRELKIRWIEIIGKLVVLLYWGYHNLTTATIKIHSKYITTEKYSFFSLRKNHYNKEEIIVVLKIFTNFNLKVFEIILKGIWRKRPCFEKIFGWVLNHTRWSLEHTEVQSLLK